MKKYITELFCFIDDFVKFMKYMSRKNYFPVIVKEIVKLA